MILLMPSFAILGSNKSIPCDPFISHLFFFPFFFVLPCEGGAGCAWIIHSHEPRLVGCEGDWGARGQGGIGAVGGF